MGRPFNPPPEFYELARVGMPCRQIADAVGRDKETVRFWARRTGTQLVDCRPDMARGEAHDRLVALNEGKPLCEPRSKYYFYRYQKKGAAKRGIAWEITFEQWVQVWADSGKWDLRGAGKGMYCMCRNGDIGPYKVGNVRIAPFEQNLAERWSNNGGSKFKQPH